MSYAVTLTNDNTTRQWQRRLNRAMQSDKIEWTQLCRVTKKNGYSSAEWHRKMDKAMTEWHRRMNTTMQRRMDTAIQNDKGEWRYRIDTAMQSDKGEWTQLCRVTKENEHSYAEWQKSYGNNYAKENGHSYAEWQRRMNTAKQRRMDIAMQSDKGEWIQLCRVTKENGYIYVEWQRRMDRVMQWQRRMDTAMQSDKGEWRQQYSDKRRTHTHWGY